MGTVVFLGLMLILAIICWTIRIPDVPNIVNFAKNIVGGFLALIAVGTSFTGAVGYNDSGYCVYIQTAFGSENAKCDLGWYFAGWGTTTTYPHYITIAHTNDAQSEGSAISKPYSIRMSDNWSGDVTQTTRFGIPQDIEQFMRMHREFRSLDRLVSTTLKPAVTASLDSVANLFSMEEYYAGGRRDDFKTEYRETVVNGRAVVDREEVAVDGVDLDHTTAPSASAVAADTAETGGSERVRFITKKRLDANGNPIRIPHGYGDVGITVTTAILENLDPDDLYETQIADRKAAAARRSIAVEKRLEEEEQRLLAITKSEREIAERQGEARQKQIVQTTEAETEKRLALTIAERQREEARIAKQTAELTLERARVDAQAVQVTADAEAYQKKVILEADGALAQKLAAYVETQRVWADAYSKRPVPNTYFAGAGGEGGIATDSDVQNFLRLKTVEAAQNLQVNPSIGSGTAAYTTNKQ